MPHDDPKTRILRAAMQLWAEKGYEKATMRELARRVGMNASGIYQHFAGKEAIVQHFYAELNAACWADFDEDGPSGDVGRDLVRFLRLKLDRLTHQRSAATGLLREAIDPDSRLSPLHPDSDGTLSGNIDRFTGWVDKAGIAAIPGMGPDAADLARGLWMIHIGVLVFWLHDRSEGAALTERLLERVGNLGQLMPLMGMVPGMPDLFALFGELLNGPTAEEALPDGPTATPDVDRTADVVVIGAGPVGCLTAAFLKQLRPATRVVVLEAEEAPVYKVGESTLSGFCKALRSIGIRQEALQKLFFTKNGLGFTWAGGGRTIETGEEYVLETFDETFQVERRVLDGLILARMEQLDIDVIQGARVDLKASTLEAGENVLVARIGGVEKRFGCRWVVDATGPKAGIARMHGLWTDDGIAFQNHAVWAAFEDVAPLQEQLKAGPGNDTLFPRDEYTWHLCFPQGWVWWIPQVSWADAPQRNLDRAYRKLLREGRLPTREDLVDAGCPVNWRVSVGLVVRSDRDDLGVTGDPEAAFAEARKRLPVLDSLLDGARLVPDLGPQGPWMQRKNVRGHAREVVGDGWLAVGDAAFFVDPLISPGLTAGTATAWQAADHLARALEGTPTVGDFDGYQAFTRRLHQALELDNQLVYHSFDHPELMALVQRFQEVTARTHFLEGDDAYGEQDTNVWGVLTPAYAEQARALHGLLSQRAADLDARVPIGEQRAEDHAETVRLAHELLDPHLDENRHLTPYLKEDA